MLRLSRLSLFMLANSRSPELPNFLTTTDATPAPHVTVDDLVFKTVMEYDHQEPMPEIFNESNRTLFFANSAFSGSAVAPGLATVGTLLFFYTFCYNVGKPVVDSHRELWYSESDPEEEEDEAIKRIIEDEDDA